MPELVTCPACSQPYEIDHDMVGEAFICECQQAYEIGPDLSLVPIQVRQAGAPHAQQQAQPQQQTRPQQQASVPVPPRKKKGNPHAFLWIFLIFGLGALIAAGVMMYQVNQQDKQVREAKVAKEAAARASIAESAPKPGEKRKLTLKLSGNEITDASSSKTIEAPTPSAEELPVDWNVTPDPYPSSWTLASDFNPTNVLAADRIILSKASSPFAAFVKSSEITGIFQYTLFDFSKGAVVKSVETPLSPYLQMEDCAMSPDGKWVAREESQETLKGIRIWDAATATPLHKFPDVSDGAEILFLGFADAQNLVAVYGSNPRKIRRFNVVDQVEINAFETAQLSSSDARTKQAFALSPGGAQLAILSQGVRAGVSIYQLADGTLAGKLKTVEGTKSCAPSGIAFAESGTSLAALTRNDRKDYAITGWNLETGQVNAEAGPLAAAEMDLVDHAMPIRWLRDSSGWLVDGRLVMDRAGQVIQTLDASGAKRRDYYIAGDDQLIRFAHGEAAFKVVPRQ